MAYVGNISFDVDDAAIAAFFEGCGVTKVRLHTDKETGRSKGYAHVHFEDEGGLDRYVGNCGGYTLLHLLMQGGGEKRAGAGWAASACLVCAAEKSIELGWLQVAGACKATTCTWQHTVQAMKSR